MPEETTPTTTDDAAADAETDEHATDNASGRVLPEDSMLAALVEPFLSAVSSQVEVAFGPDQDVLQVDASEYHGFVQNAHETGFDVFVDLCGVDYFRRAPRFEVVVNLMSYEHNRRIRIRIGVDGETPVLPTISDVFPGANFYERETFDLFGIVFEGHPDLTRILLPDEWEGHPLRKDYAVGSVPVQFKGANHAR